MGSGMEKQREFERSGVYMLEESSSTVFLEPVRMLNRHYSRFRVSSSAYYPRFFDPTPEPPSPDSNKRKRKRKQKRKPKLLNQRELIAEQRHQEVREVLVRAHQALLQDQAILQAIRNLKNHDSDGYQGTQNANQLSFPQLESIWQSPLYQITLTYHHQNDVATDGAAPILHHHPPRTSVQLFHNMVRNETSHEVDALFLDNNYIIPKQTSFYMSHLENIRNLIPVESDYGYNLIVIDPPWENGSAHQKLMYQTLPNRYFLSIPVKQLTHTAGAVVALWVTNREKLRSFVKNELFSAWGVKYIANFYWLKVKADGSLISDMDLFHHRPYECLMLGYCNLKGSEVSTLKPIPENKVFISIPGEYSRKPPVGELLKEYTPGLESARCIELFAREMIPGWTSWGNEPLHFQNSKNFVVRAPEIVTFNVQGE